MTMSCCTLLLVSLSPNPKTLISEVVTYKPTEYGKPVQGKLIIQTEDLQRIQLFQSIH